MGGLIGGLVGGIAGIGGSLFGGFNMAKAIKKAQGLISTGYDEADQILRNIWSEQKPIFDEQMGLYSPYVNAGTSGVIGLQRLAKEGIDITKVPAYQARLEEGQKAVERSAAGRLGVLSGAGMKELSRYGQTFASEEYQNEYARQFNTLSQLANLGTFGATGSANVLGSKISTLGNLGQNRANLKTEKAVNLANLQVKKGATWQGAINQATTQFGQMIPSLFGSPSEGASEKGLLSMIF